MPSGLRRVYLDSDVLLSFVNGHPERSQTIDAVFHEARRREIQLFTSGITAVEVAFGANEQANQALDDDTFTKIEALWMPGFPVEQVDYYRLIGDDARALMRHAITKGWSIKPMDAIHLATARRIEASELFTYNLEDFQKFEDATGLRICHPYTLQPLLRETE